MKFFYIYSPNTATLYIFLKKKLLTSFDWRFERFTTCLIVSLSEILIQCTDTLTVKFFNTRFEVIFYKIIYTID